MPRLYSRLLAALVLTGAALPAQAATILVTSTADGVANDSNCTLREAVLSANTNSGTDACAAGSPSGDVILFTAIAGQTITLTGGLIEITDGVTIGNTASAVTIVASANDRIFRTQLAGPPEPVSFVNLTLRGGAGFIGGAVLIRDNQETFFTGVVFDGNTSSASGGAVRVGLGTHTFTGCTFKDNTTTVGGSTDGGGAIYNNGGRLVVAESTFRGNTAITGSGNGGAILNGFGSTTTVTNSTFTGNRAARAGGAIESVGPLSVTGGLLAENQAGINGGAVHTAGTFTATFSGVRLTGNVAVGQGGALWNAGTNAMTVTESTFSGNTAAEGGGLYQQAGTTGTLTVERSTVSANTATTVGGGVLVGGGQLVRIVNSTVSTNTAPSGAGVAVTAAGKAALESSTVALNAATGAGGGLLSPAAGQLSIANTIVADNTAGPSNGPDCSGAATAVGPNIVEFNGCSFAGTAPVAADPGLLSLAANGGPTLTHAVAANSIARGAGQTALLVDQRNVARATPATIGAFELAGGPVAGEAPAGAAAFALGAASPNPVRGTATLHVTAGEAVEVALYDVLGRRVRVLYAGTPAGPAVVTVDAAALAPGVYVVRMTGAAAQATQRITVAR